MGRTSTASNGLKLKGFRKQNKISQAELGNKVNRDYRTVSGWETGKSNIPDSIIHTLNKLYKLNLVPKRDYSVVKSKTRGYTQDKIKSHKKTSNVSKFLNYYKSTGLSVAEFCDKYDISTASFYRVINGVGEHYLSFSSLSKLSKDVDITNIFS